MVVLRFLSMHVCGKMSSKRLITWSANGTKWFASGKHQAINCAGSNFLNPKSWSLVIVRFLWSVDLMCWISCFLTMRYSKTVQPQFGGWLQVEEHGQLTRFPTLPHWIALTCADATQLDVTVNSEWPTQWRNHKRILHLQTKVCPLAGFFSRVVYDTWFQLHCRDRREHNGIHNN